MIVRYLFVRCVQCQEDVFTLRHLNPINLTPPVTDAVPGGGRGDRICSEGSRSERLLEHQHNNLQTQTHARTKNKHKSSLAGVTSGRSDRRDTVSGGGRLIDVTPLPASILLDG